MWKVYTKTGDKGLTSTASQTRISKDSSLINLQGGIDEINASIGYLRSLVYLNKKLNNLNEELKSIQHDLFLIGSEISYNLNKEYIKSTSISFLEEKIDFMTRKSPEINFFVYCSGSIEATYAGVIRTIVRRVERNFVSFLNENNIESFPNSYLFINRLSDYFFSLSRYINVLNNIEEEPLEF